MSSRTSRKRILLEDDSEDGSNRKRHHSTPKDRNQTPRETKPSTAKKGQKTLTQIDFLPSSRTHIDDVALEYEPSPAQRRSTGRRKKTRKPIQSDTLTQMDFLLPALPGNEDEEIINDDLAYDLSTPLQKRPKGRAPREEPLARAIYNRNPKKRAMGHLNLTNDENTLPDSPTQQSMSADLREASIPATPPRLASRTWRREIPSSQSPPDTPLSIRKQRPSRETSRSPLRERSLNVPTPIRAANKATISPRKLEIADSMDSENERSQTSVRSQGTSKPSRMCYMPENIRIRTDSQMTGFKGSVEDTSVLEKTQTVGENDVGTSEVTQIKSEVEDSYEENGAEDLNDDDSATGAEMQAAKAAIKTQYDSGSQTPEEDSAECFLASNTAVRDSGAETLSDQAENENSPHRLRRARRELSIPNFDDPSPREASPTDTRPIPRAITEIPSSAPVTKRLQSPELLDQLTSPPRGAEPESQLDDIRPEISSPPHLSPDMIPSSQPSSPDPHRYAPLSPPPLPTSSFLIPPLPQQPAPVPPSQATTVDFSPPQPSHPFHASHRGTASSPQNLSSPLPPHPLPRTTTTSTSRRRRPSNPPSPPTFSSSPLYTRKSGADSWIAHGDWAWDGKRLTDSQLLPESVMNARLVGPPGWETQESLEEE